MFFLTMYRFFPQIAFVSYWMYYFHPYFTLCLYSLCISITHHNRLFILSQVSSFVFYWRKKWVMSNMYMIKLVKEQYFANCLTIHSFANTDISLTNHSKQ